MYRSKLFPIEYGEIKYIDDVYPAKPSDMYSSTVSRNYLKHRRDDKPIAPLDFLRRDQL